MEGRGGVVDLSQQASSVQRRLVRRENIPLGSLLLCPESGLVRLGSSVLQIETTLSDLKMPPKKVRSDTTCPRLGIPDAYVAHRPCLAVRIPFASPELRGNRDTGLGLEES